MAYRTRSGLTLDSFVPADAARLCEVDGDPEHRRRFEFPEGFVPSEEHSARVIARWTEERRAGVRFPLAVREAATGELVGGCELQPSADAAARLSYWTHPRYRGRGIASQAVQLVCTLAFTELGIRRLELEADADNLASRRIALLNGFREVGTRSGRVMYVLEQESWRTFDGDAEAARTGTSSAHHPLPLSEPSDRTMPPELSPRLAELVDALPLYPGIRVLEIGCGPGAAARAVANRIGDGHVLAIDRSATAIRQTLARSRPEISSGRLSARRSAIENFELLPGEEPFDIAFAFRVGALDGRHPELQQRAHQRITRALVPSGRLFLDGGDPLREVALPPSRDREGALRHPG